MKRSALAGSLAFLLASFLLAAPARKPTFKTAKDQAIGLHRSLVPLASPQVRAKITATAKAARAYLAQCGRNCDLHTFLTEDIGRRF
jgi:hypothetical protein